MIVIEMWLALIEPFFKAPILMVIGIASVGIVLATDYWRNRNAEQTD